MKRKVVLLSILLIALAGCDTRNSSQTVESISTPTGHVNMHYASFDFSSVESGNSALTATDLLEMFHRTEKIGISLLIESFSNVTSVYRANSEEGPKISGIKIGDAEREGTLTAHLMNTGGFVIIGISITCAGWSSSTVSTISINDSTKQTLSTEEITTLSFPVNSRTLNFVFENRVVIQQILFYAGGI